MIGFGSTADGGSGRTDRDADERQEEPISFKDNRRIDPNTGEARQPGGAPDAAGGWGGLPQPGSPAANPGDPANAEQRTEATVTAASEELAAARAEAQERTGDLQRLTAEYANYRKRVERDKVAATTTGKAAVVSELLAVCDDLDRAADHGDLTGGFKNVADKLTDTLQRIGVEKYGAEGDEFDPNVHEAVQFSTSADVEHPTVTTVLRSGYTFAERVLRAAVVVVTGPVDESDESGDEPSASTVDEATLSDELSDEVLTDEALNDEPAQQ